MAKKNKDDMLHLPGGLVGLVNDVQKVQTTPPATVSEPVEQPSVLDQMNLHQRQPRTAPNRMPLTDAKNGLELIDADSQWGNVLRLAVDYRQADGAQAVILIDEHMKLLLDRIKSSVDVKITTKSLVSAIVHDFVENNRDVINQVLTGGRMA